MGSKPDYCTCFIIVLMASLFIIPVSCHILKNLGICTQSISDISTYASAIIAYCAFVAAIHEYRIHKDEVKTDILSKYNARYSSDKHIENVVNYLIQKEDGLKCIEPSIFDKEMFMRFFEEMELSIEKYNLPKEEVYDLFAYYAIEVHQKGESFLKEYKPKEYDNPSTKTGDWENFYKFATSMMRIREKREKEKINKK